MANITLSVLALLTGLLTGAVFRFLNVPIPAPPKLSGVLGIFGIYLGYTLLGELDVGIDLVSYF